MWAYMCRPTQLGHVLQALCKDARMLPAGGAPEIEVCQQLQKFGRKETGLDQYAIAKFAESLEVHAADEYLHEVDCIWFTCRHA